MNRLLTGVLFVVILSVAAMPASAMTLVNPVEPLAEPYQAWADASHMPMPSIRITGEPCDGARPVVACAAFGHTIRMPNPTRVTPYVFFHEAGHLAHAQFFMDVQARLGVVLAHASNASLSETVADAFSACAMRVAFMTRPRPIGYGYAPSPEQHRQACNIMREEMGVGAESAIIQTTRSLVTMRGRVSPRRLRRGARAVAATLTTAESRRGELGAALCGRRRCYVMVQYFDPFATYDASCRVRIDFRTTTRVTTMRFVGVDCIDA